MLVKIIIGAFLCLQFYGCAVLSDWARVQSEQAHSVSKGQVLVQKQRLYSAVVPDSYMYALFGKPLPKSLSLHYQDAGLASEGSYYVLVFDRKGCRAIGGLPEVFRKCFLGKFLKQRRHLKTEVEILQEKETVWKTYKGLYVEFFIPGDIKSSHNGRFVYVKRNNFAYAALMIEGRGEYFLIGYADSVEPAQVNSGVKIPARVRDKFNSFLEGVTLYP